MRKTLLLTLGRLPKGLDLARGFHARGWRVVVAEPFGWHLCRVSRAVAASRRLPPPARRPETYLKALVDLALREDAALLIPVSEETLHVAHVRDRLPARTRVFAPAADRVVRLHDKKRFISWAAGLGLPAPRTARLGTPEAARIAAQGPFVVKPVFSCAGNGVSFHSAGAHPTPLDGTVPHIIQERLEGNLLSTFALIHDGYVQTNVVYRGTVFSGTVAVAFERLDDVAPVERWVRDFAKRSCHSGFLSFDFVLGADGFARAIECNPRITSGVHFLNAVDLAAAIETPATAPPIRLKPTRHMQQVYPCLMETQAKLFDPVARRRNLSVLLHARDVTWAANDPWPSLTMTFTSAPILMRAIFGRMSLGLAATRDIEWFPDRPEMNQS